jgi:hypothetical protein
MVCVTLLLVTLMDIGIIASELRSVLLCITLCAVGVWLRQAGYWRPAYRLRTLTWQPHGDWLLRFADGTTVSAQLAADSWITPWMWCLRFSAADRQVVPLMVWRSQLSGLAWQLWRTRLHLQAQRSVTASQPLG